MDRQKTSEKRREALKTGRGLFCFEQIEDILDLIANEKWPNGDFGDDECVLWSMIRRKLNIDYW